MRGRSLSLCYRVKNTLAGVKVAITVNSLDFNGVKMMMMRTSWIYNNHDIHHVKHQNSIFPCYIISPGQLGHQKNNKQSPCWSGEIGSQGKLGIPSNVLKPDTPSPM